MCFKDWFTKPVIENTSKMLLSFAINNYPGSGNDLNGCINDQTDLIEKLPGWSVTAFKDHEVTRSTFRNTIKNYIVGMRAGDILLIQYSGHGTRLIDHSGDEVDNYDEALYLYDGTFSDDEFNELMLLIPDGAIVIVVLDSCFSGTATRNGFKYCKPKFVPPAEFPKRELRPLKMKANGINHIVFSGCKADQTSADSLINGRYNGAFSYFWIRAMDVNKTYKEWCDDTIYKLYIHGFEQVCTLDGPEEMINKLIFTK